MADKDILRSRGCDWVFDDLVPEEFTNSEGIPQRLKPLNLRQELLVREFVANPTAKHKDLGKAIGISASTVSDWLKLPGVRRAIQLKVQNKFKNAELDAQWILSNTRDIAERCMAVDRFSEALKALEMLGKHFEVFKDHLQIDHHVSFDPSKMSLEELELVTKLSGGNTFLIEDLNK